MNRNSIGNDIVAFNGIDAERTIQPKFYSKFITKSELALFKNLPSFISFLQFIWLCWSIKESVYKFQKRLQPELLFAYKKIIIQQINIPAGNHNLFFDGIIEKDILTEHNCINSIVQSGDLYFYSRSFISADFIYTTSIKSHNTVNIYWGIKQLAYNEIPHQSEAVRNFAKKKLQTVLCNDVEIAKSETGFPYLQSHSKILMSFSHHEQYIAYCFVINE